MFWKPYQRYDRIAEPWRFLLFMAVLIPTMVAACNPYWPVASGIGWAILLFLLITRFWYIEVRPRLKKRRD